MAARIGHGDYKMSNKQRKQLRSFLSCIFYVLFMGGLLSGIIGLIIIICLHKYLLGSIICSSLLIYLTSISFGWAVIDEKLKSHKHKL
jgi:uncharacterized membrane protein YqjE